MCGRFSLTVDGQLLMEELRLTRIPDWYVPRYNVAPGQLVLAARDAGGERRAGQLKWGLVPSWAEEPSIGYRMINARSESVREKPSFRSAFEKRRCIIPADGFYEWRKEGKAKIPQRFVMKSRRPFAFAGLWETWRPKGGAPGEPIHSFTILTTEANEVVSPVHDRMPVIIPIEQLDLWLDPEVPGDGVEHLLKPYPAEEMESYEVSTIVNSPKNDNESCIEPRSAAG